MSDFELNDVARRIQIAIADGDHELAFDDAMTLIQTLHARRIARNRHLAAMCERLESEAATNKRRTKKPVG